MTFSAFARTLMLLTLMTVACKKDKDPVPGQPNNPADSVMVSEFCFLPTKDATWRFHYQGSMGYDPISGGYTMDTTVHFYSEVSATGKDTFINSRKYYIYTFTKLAKYTTHIFNMNGTFYMREDTAGKTTIISKRSGNTFTPDRSGIDFNIKPGDAMPFQFYKWPVGTVVDGDSIKLDGISYQPLMMRIKGKDYFFQSYGIGGLAAVTHKSGIDLGGNGSTIRSLDFKYKTDSLHFDYDLFP